MINRQNAASAEVVVVEKKSFDTGRITFLNVRLLSARSESLVAWHGRGVVAAVWPIHRASGCCFITIFHERRADCSALAAAAILTELRLLAF